MVYKNLLCMIINAWYLNEIGQAINTISAISIITILYCKLEFPIVVYYFLNNAVLSIRPARLWPWNGNVLRKYS